VWDKAGFVPPRGEPAHDPLFSDQPRDIVGFHLDRGHGAMLVALNSKFSRRSRHRPPRHKPAGATVTRALNAATELTTVLARTTATPPATVSCGSDFIQYLEQSRQNTMPGCTLVVLLDHAPSPELGKWANDQALTVLHTPAARSWLALVRRCHANLAVDLALRDHPYPRESITAALSLAQHQPCADHAPVTWNQDPATTNAVFEALQRQPLRRRRSRPTVAPVDPLVALVRLRANRPPDFPRHLPPYEFLKYIRHHSDSAELTGDDCVLAMSVLAARERRLVRIEHDLYHVIKRWWASSDAIAAETGLKDRNSASKRLSRLEMAIGGRARITYSSRTPDPTEQARYLPGDRVRNLVTERAEMLCARWHRELADHRSRADIPAPDDQFAVLAFAADQARPSDPERRVRDVLDAYLILADIRRSLPRIRLFFYEQAAAHKVALATVGAPLGRTAPAAAMDRVRLRERYTPAPKPQAGSARESSQPRYYWEPIQDAVQGAISAVLDESAFSLLYTDSLSFWLDELVEADGALTNGTVAALRGLAGERDQPREQDQPGDLKIRTLANAHPHLRPLIDTLTHLRKQLMSLEEQQQ
jgi:hypothetical protein